MRFYPTYKLDWIDSFVRCKNSLQQMNWRPPCNSFLRSSQKLHDDENNRREQRQQTQLLWIESDSIPNETRIFASGRQPNARQNVD